MESYPTWHVNVITLKREIIWTSGLPHLPGVPHLHVNRPLYGSKVRCLKTLYVAFCFTWSWDFYFQFPNDFEYCFGQQINGDNRQISTTAGFDRWQTWQVVYRKSRSVLSSRLLIWHCIFVFYINCVLSKDTISVYVKLKAIRLNKLDVRKLCTRTELKTLQLSVNRNGSGIRQKQGVTEENANNKLTNPQCDLEEKVHSLPPWY